MSIALKVVPGTAEISDDEMRRSAPSVFASQPIEGVSERYSFLAASSILNGMRENGWVPVRAQEQCIRTSKRCFRSVDGERFVVILKKSLQTEAASAT